MPVTAETPPPVDTWVRHVPNALTLLRLAAVPVFCALIIRAEGATTSAGVLFIVASLTDFADGVLARRMGVMTQFGKVADPLADRLLIGAAAVLLSVYGELPGWACVAVLWRDFLAVLGFVIVRRQILPDVNFAGKAGTLLMMAGVAGMLLFVDSWPQWLFWGGFALSAIALGEYITKYSWVIRRGQRAD